MVHAYKDLTFFLSLESSSAGNPAVIAGSQFLVLNGGSQGADRRSLQPFVTGSPVPVSTQTTWQFNGRSNLPPGTFVLESGELLLGSTLTREHSGVYTYTVRTSAGEASAHFNVSVSKLLLLWCQPDKTHKKVGLCGQK